MYLKLVKCLKTTVEETTVSTFTFSLESDGGTLLQVNVVTSLWVVDSTGFIAYDHITLSFKTDLHFIVWVGVNQWLTRHNLEETSGDCVFWISVLTGHGVTEVRVVRNLWWKHIVSLCTRGE